MTGNYIKKSIAKNIVELRKSFNITQLELAEKLNYTDKAVSKWERGESIPDIVVLKDIADIFSVSVDYLISSDHKNNLTLKNQPTNRQKRNRRIISAMASVLVWFIATFIYVNVDIISTSYDKHWLLFIYAVPVTLIVLLVLNCIWGKRKFTFILISALIWTLLFAIYITFFSKDMWRIIFIGVPAQVITLLWSALRSK